MGRDGRSDAYKTAVESLHWDDLPPPNTVRYPARPAAWRFDGPFIPKAGRRSCNFSGGNREGRR